MDCPTCSYPVTAEWLTCRRCGAALKIGPESTRVTIPSTMHRRQSAPGGAITTAPRVARPVARPDARFDATARPYAAPASTPAGMAAALQRRADTRLPGAFPRPDNLLPRAVLGGPAPLIAERRRVNVRARGTGILREPIQRVQTFVHEHRRRAVLVGLAGVALVAGSVRPVILANETTTFPQTRAAHKAIATDLLRGVVGAGRTLYAPGQTYEQVTPAVLSSFASNLPVVAANSAAAPGTVSMRVVSAKVLMLATPADNERCVFARDDAARGRTQFKTVRTTDCRASAAPTAGWAK